MKITFMGAGSTVFARNVLGDCMCVDSLKDSVFAILPGSVPRACAARATVALETSNSRISFSLPNSFIYSRTRSMDIFFTSDSKYKTILASKSNNCNTYN